MKSSHRILLVGAGIVISGLMIGAYAVMTFEEIGRDWPLFTNYKSPKPYALQPGSNITFPIPARVGDGFSIGVKQDPIQVPISIQIKDPNGNVVVNQIKEGHTTTQFTATTPGTQHLIIINNGTGLTSVSLSIVTLALAGFPFIYLIILAGIIIIMGIIMLVVGGVNYIKGRRARQDLQS